MSKDLLLDLFEKVNRKQIFDEELFSFLELIFPGKSANVLDVLTKGIKKYIYKPSNRIVWAAMGKKKEHLVYPRIFCSCQDFYKTVVVYKKRNFCKHILAQIISEALNRFKTIELDDNKFKEFVRDLKLHL
ncbi:hypothetical protein LCGC14_0385570 [marine sediment metagenome]|uniref:SWIM-type domain-containing protein n=1 Tax=marine sediment metagenome TaxID=412755 RepID=A0A0F9T0Z9_9ZZZZ|nr:MAG: hypothetical protein Lokiarch_34150 [Candidatus Lokiarchaeum sp. GC14_75]